jgi:hypothetical protein
MKRLLIQKDVNSAFVAISILKEWHRSLDEQSLLLVIQLALSLDLESSSDRLFFSVYNSPTIISLSALVGIIQRAVSSDAEDFRLTIVQQPSSLPSSSSTTAVLDNNQSKYRPTDINFLESLSSKVLQQFTLDETQLIENNCTTIRIVARSLTKT